MERYGDTTVSLFLWLLINRDTKGKWIMELDMTKGKPSRLILKFMIPVIIGNIFQQLYNMVDTIIVGRFIGVKALAAVGATGTIMFLILGFMMGITTGFTVLTAQRFGAGDYKAMKKSIGNAVILSVATTLVMTAVSVLCMEGLLRVMNTPDDIFEMAQEYITIICYGMGFTVLYNLMASILRAVGNSTVPLIFLVVSSSLNIILDLIFIIVFHMGVGGAAYATIISQGISGILCLFYIKAKVPLLHIDKGDLEPDRECIINQIKIGVPMALQFSITAIGTILVQSSLNLLGSVVVAAFTAANKVSELVTQPFNAMGMTMATYGAQNMGIHDFKRMKKGVRSANIMSAIYSVVIYFVIIPFIPAMLHLFVNGDISAMLGYVRTYLLLSGIFYIPLGMIFIYRNILQGAGYSFAPMMGGAVELICRSIVAFIAAKSMSYVGICMANVTAWLVTGIYLMISYIVIMKRIEKKDSVLKQTVT